MSERLLFGLIALPIVLHLLVAFAVYYDAGRVPLSRTKWTLIALAVPLFGVFAYLFERGELSYDPEEDPYRSGGFGIHHSHREDDNDE